MQKMKLFFSKLNQSVYVALVYTLFFIYFFSPVLFSSKLFPSDGLLPSFFSSIEFWTNTLFAGYPVFAEIQWQTFYPIRIIFGVFPGNIGFNLYVIFAYILSAFCTYGYVFAITRHSISALLSGFVFSMSGFMMAHLGHTSMLHSASWLPLFLWSLESLRSGFSKFWFGTGIIASAMMFLSGHPQIFLYSMILCGSYSLFSAIFSNKGWKSYLLYSALIVFFCLGLIAFQLFPTKELVEMSTRKELSFADFSKYSMPLNQLPQIVFPFLFCAEILPFSYFGKWNIVEVTGFVGVSTLVLAGIGIATHRKNPIAIFWLSAVCVSFVFALDAPFVKRWMFHMPGINSFRCTARFFILFSFGVAVLSGYGFCALYKNKAENSIVYFVISVCVFLFLCLLVFIFDKYHLIVKMAENEGRAYPPFFKNYAILIPAISFAALSTLLALRKKIPGGEIRSAIIIVVVVIDLGSFSWFCRWRYLKQDTYGDIPYFVTNYCKVLKNSYGRIAETQYFRKNATRLYNIESLSGYGPLTLKRYSEISGMRASGSFDISTILDENNCFSEIISLKYFIYSPSKSYFYRKNEKWSPYDIDCQLSRKESYPFRKEFKIILADPVHAAGLKIVSKLAKAVDVSQNQEIAKITLTRKNGTKVEKALLAGRDTSEWAIDYDKVKKKVAHRKARVFKSFYSPQKKILLPQLSCRIQVATR